jgi:hypothetical protein
MDDGCSDMQAAHGSPIVLRVLWLVWYMTPLAVAHGPARVLSVALWR